MILTLEQAVPEHLKSSFKKLFVWTIFCVTCLYVTFGGSGYLSFGPETKDLITLNLPYSDGFNFALFVKSLLGAALYFTYPLMMFPVTALLQQRLHHIFGCAKVSFNGNILAVRWRHSEIYPSKDYR